MSLYVTVLATTLIVSLLGLTGLTVVRIERSRASVINDRVVARANARSAVELALRAIADDADWRNTYINGVETAPRTLSATRHGTVSWILEDTDGSLADTDTQLRLKGVGRVGATTQVSSIEVEQAVQPPQELRSQTSSSNQSTDQLVNNKWWGQYFKANLPPEATGWKVTSVELYVRKGNVNRGFNVRIYKSQASRLPSGNALDSVDLNSNDFSGSFQWQTINFGGDYQIAPSDGVCLTIETTAPGVPIEFDYSGGGVSEVDSALIKGTPTWDSSETEKALLYRAHGVYWTSSAEIQPIAGTWRWEAAP
jgi:Tfp pilus assembly protein PilX